MMKIFMLVVLFGIAGGIIYFLSGLKEFARTFFGGK